MLHLRTRTEYSCENGKPKGTGTVKDLVSFAVQNKMEAIALTDTNCFGHREFQDACLEAKIEPIFGMEFAWPFREGTLPRVALARTQDGLQELYSMKAGDQVSDNIVLLEPSLQSPAYIFENQEILHGLRWPNDAYAIYPRHLCDYYVFPNRERPLEDQFESVRIPKAKPPQVTGINIAQVCSGTLINLGLNKSPYSERLCHELTVIHSKGFEGYFRIVTEVCQWANSVGIAQGPGRGSSSGSLVAYLLGITEVDPIKHDLLFERFLDPSRTLIWTLRMNAAMKYSLTLRISMVQQAWQELEPFLHGRVKPLSKMVYGRLRCPSHWAIVLGIGFRHASRGKKVRLIRFKRR